MTDRLDELKGAVKKTAGKATGDEGREAEGQAEQTAAKAARETKGAANRAAGGVKATVGDALDDERLQAEGEAQQAKGETQSAG
jgi:uncharacterized protein YjbJ (UPF0337 family)